MAPWRSAKPRAASGRRLQIASRRTSGPAASIGAYPFSAQGPAPTRPNEIGFIASLYSSECGSVANGHDPRLARASAVGDMATGSTHTYAPRLEVDEVGRGHGGPAARARPMP